MSGPADQEPGGDPPGYNKFVDNGMEFMGFEGRKPEDGPPPKRPVAGGGPGGRAHEAGYEKMKAARTGSVEPGLGPSEAEEALQKQQALLQQQSAAQGQQQAAQAQGQQSTPQPPPAPTGPQGVSQPYPAQAGPQEEGR